MSYIDNLLTDFTKANCITWLKEIVLCFKNPRSFVNTVAAKSSDDFIPQYVFYFFLYTISFFVLLIGNDPLGALKPALLSLINAFVLILIFTFSAFLATGRNYLRKITIYIIAVIFFTTPVLLLLYSQFLTTENYLFKLGSSICSSFVQLCCFVLFPFFIEATKKKWSIFFVSFLVLNLLWLAASFIKFDDYQRDGDFLNYDPIISEYSNTYEILENRDSIPVARVFYRSKTGIVNTFLTQDMVDTNFHAEGSAANNQNYIKSTKNNLAILEKSISNAKFERNKAMFVYWKEYYQKILTECNYPIINEQQFQNMYLQKAVVSQNINGRQESIMYIRNLPIIAHQMQLKRMHNNLALSFENAQLPLVISDRIKYLLGYVLEGIYMDYIQTPKKTVYREKFKPINSSL